MAKNEDVDNHLLVIGYNDEISSVSYIINHVHVYTYTFCMFRIMTTYVAQHAGRQLKQNQRRWQI